MKTLKTDKVNVLHLSDIKDWNCYTLIAGVIKHYGVYTCLLNGKKTMIVK